MVDPLTISYTPGRTTWPDTAIMRVPGDVSVPIVVKVELPSRAMNGRFDNVSTLLTIVGCPYRPTAAGKYGGFRRGMPRSPSSDSISAVSSPTT